MNPPDQELTRLIEAYLDDSLAPREVARLSARLEQDKDARALYLKLSRQHAALTLWGEQQTGRAAAQPPGETIPFPSPRRTARRRWAWLAAAAGLAVATLLTWRLARPAPAMMTYAGDAVWETGTGPRADGDLARGEHVLRAGVTRFVTRAGAAVSVAAPARFRLVSADRIELSEGRLTARMQREDARLTVVSGGAEITDLGTSFGVDATQPGKAQVVVFDGEVAVKKGAGQELRLTEGQAAQASEMSVAAAKYDPEAFRDLWPLTVGIHEASETVEFLPPGPMLRPLREYRADGKLFLLPEQQKAVTDAAYAIDLSTDVTQWPDSPVSPYPLMRGHRVSSYLVFFQPVSVGKGVRRLSGEITFHQRVLAIICSDNALTATDARLGLKSADYRTPGQRRGLEEADKENYRGAQLPHDSISLTNGGHTVRFDLFVSDEREQMRIVVAAP